ncbi:MAG: hypothetical protein ACR2NM_09930, partial [Bythopirellula sp.]
MVRLPAADLRWATRLVLPLPPVRSQRAEQARCSGDGCKLCYLLQSVQTVRFPSALAQRVGPARWP